MPQTDKPRVGTPPRYPGAPRWVKTSGVVVGVLAFLVVILMFVGGGRHGPLRHLPSAGANVGQPDPATGQSAVGVPPGGDNQ